MLIVPSINLYVYIYFFILTASLPWFVFCLSIGTSFVCFSARAYYISGLGLLSEDVNK
jgi:hypothetical protein